jgi:hypothetical protein
MAFQSLEDAVFNATSLADPMTYVIESGNFNELFSNRRGGRIGLLHYMVMVKSKAGVELMLHHGADPNLRTSDGLTPLWTALLVKDFELIRLLVEKGADVNGSEPDRGDTPLHGALVQSCEDIAQYLLDHGASPDVRNKLGISPRQVQLFNNLRHHAPKAPQGELHALLATLVDEPNEQSLGVLLELCQTLLANKVQQGSMSPIKAQTLDRKITDFKEVLSRPEKTMGAGIAKAKRMQEIINEVKVWFTEDLTR